MARQKRLLKRASTALLIIALLLTAAFVIAVSISMGNTLIYLDSRLDSIREDLIDRARDEFDPHINSDIGNAVQGASAEAQYYKNNTISILDSRLSNRTEWVRAQIFPGEENAGAMPANHTPFGIGEIVSEVEAIRKEVRASLGERN